MLNVARVINSQTETFTCLLELPRNPSKGHTCFRHRRYNHRCSRNHPQARQPKEHRTPCINEADSTTLCPRAAAKQTR